MLCNKERELSELYLYVRFVECVWLFRKNASHAFTVFSGGSFAYDILKNGF